MPNGYPTNNVYIGARYVPKLVGEWDSTKETAYEPLIIVTYQGNSYTSRQYVPAGIDISNTEYWVLTGNFNGQIESFRLALDAVKKQADETADNLTAIKDSGVALLDCIGYIDPGGLKGGVVQGIDTDGTYLYGFVQYVTGSNKKSYIFKALPTGNIVSKAEVDYVPGKSVAVHNGKVYILKTDSTLDVFSTSLSYLETIAVPDSIALSFYGDKPVLNGIDGQTLIIYEDLSFKSVVKSVTYTADDIHQDFCVINDSAYLGMAYGSVLTVNLITGRQSTINFPNRTSNGWLVKELEGCYSLNGRLYVHSSVAGNLHKTIWVETLMEVVLNGTSAAIIHEREEASATITPSDNKTFWIDGGKNKFNSFVGAVCFIGRRNGDITGGTTPDEILTLDNGNVLYLNNVTLTNVNIVRGQVILDKCTVVLMGCYDCVLQIRDNCTVNSFPLAERSLVLAHKLDALKSVVGGIAVLASGATVNSINGVVIKGTGTITPT